MADYVIGDIHGCILTFQKLLKKLDLTEGDSITLLGDLVDRGPSSKQLLDLLMEMKADSKIMLKIIRGNHEIMLLESLKSKESLKSWLKRGGKETLQSFKVKDSKYIETKYISFINSFIPYIKTKKFIITHGGLNFSINNPLKDTRAMAWERNDYDLDPVKLKGRQLIVGHSPRPKYVIKKSIDDHRIMLDGGCCYKKVSYLGRLFALELNEKKLYWQKNID